jgi:hypothetical protein
MGGVAVICVLSALRPHISDQILGFFISRRKLRMALAYAGDGVTSGCHSLVEGVLKKILQLEVLVSVSPPQTAPLGDLASGKLLS